MLVRFKFRGRIPDDDTAHQMATLVPADGLLPAPKWVPVPSGGYVPQYAPTVVGKGPAFDPSNDCEGCFTSHKFQVHNNCYNYAVDIATNTVAQPGRLHGIVLKGNTDGDQVQAGAEKDGLILVGGPTDKIDVLRAQQSKLGDGHFVALLIAPAVAEATFPGDYHWVRCDDFNASCWSQKDGPDQMTDFDFAGSRIYDPSTANWTVNSGPFNPPKSGNRDFIVTYQFKAWMFVPHATGSVDII
jgi:hypothetical protein